MLQDGEWVGVWGVIITGSRITWGTKETSSFSKNVRWHWVVWMTTLARRPPVGTCDPAYLYIGASLVAQMPALTTMPETWVQSLCREGRSPGGGRGNPLQYSCLENPMDRGAWRATVHVVAKSQKDWVTNTFFLSKWAPGVHERLKLLAYFCICQ